MEKDYYSVLGIERSATADEIKKAYRKIAMQYHPDKNPGNKAAEEKFKAATEAYDVLSHPEKRNQYDQFGTSGFQGGDSPYGDDFFEGDLNDLFQDSPFSSFFAGGRRTRRASQYGEDLRIRIKLNLKEIALGTEKKVKVKRYTSCDVCGGNGAENGLSVEKCGLCKGHGVVRKTTQTMLGNMLTESICSSCAGTGSRIKTPCRDCHGAGRKFIDDLITFQVPKGVKKNMELTLRGKGNAPPRGGMPGSLIVQIEEEEDDLLKRKGNNICYTLHVSFIDATLGCEMEVPTIYGKVRLKIPPGTSCGEVLKLKGKGIADINSYNKKGDQLVFIQIWTPQELTKEEKELLLSLRDSPNFIPRPNKKEENFFERIKSFFQG
ncbi:molecular chaperone DnaJ [Cardinium endosymbiont of Oedothorax gibbosus]|uniref:molecular chaperone DnaJ n=1 Tax=Cardinium endosymbiont of Oedothorax gibbosus TaxID=931101 RepID=UPI0020240819|nr:molecular chaperone DnaJ [Cardinium endosymbiont of Oedothorax gibbosus]CAH2559590.1 Chaperone protein DnaJ [Cardinium endosymbiont of Oedothorax gibbosus]